MRGIVKVLSAILILGIALFISCSTESENVAISADGVEIRFDVQGEGEPALVFVHGWSGNRTNWDVQMDYFSDKYKVIAIDLAGFGESSNIRNNWTMDAFAKDVVAVINQLNIDNVILVGYSMGTPVVLKTAIQIPRKVVGIIPIDMLHDVGQKMTEEQIDNQVNSFMNLVNNPTEEMMRAWFVRDVEDDIISDFIDQLNSAQKHGWEESLRSTYLWMSEDQVNDLKLIKIPISCINSDQRIPDIDLIRDYTPYFKAKIIKNVGHLLMWEVTDEFNSLLEETIQEFLDSSK